MYTTRTSRSSQLYLTSLGLNESGQIVGQLYTSDAIYSFLYSGGTYTILTDPLASY